MKRPHVKRDFALGVFFSFMATMLCAQEETIEVSFNLLFPQNWYTRTLQSCVQIWGDLDAVIADLAMPLEQQFMLIDAAIGKITYVYSFLNRIQSDDMRHINEEDYDYLQRMLYKIEVRCERLTGRRYDDRLSCLIDGVNSAKQKLISLFQADNASSGTDH